jgi:hypothetical protein
VTHDTLPTTALCVPTTSSISCDQVILPDQATDASAFSDAVVVEIGSLGPSHVNVDLLVLRPRAQAAQHKVYRELR